MFPLATIQWGNNCAWSELILTTGIVYVGDTTSTLYNECNASIYDIYPYSKCESNCIAYIKHLYSVCCIERRMLWNESDSWMNTRPKNMDDFIGWTPSLYSVWVIIKSKKCIEYFTSHRGADMLSIVRMRKTIAIFMHSHSSEYSCVCILSDNNAFRWSPLLLLV